MSLTTIPVKSKKYTGTHPSTKIRKVRDVLIELPIISQRLDVHDKKWAPQACGICSLKMVMSFVDPKINKIPVIKLIKRCQKMSGFIPGIGWRHQTLVDLAKVYGVDFDREFYKPANLRKKNIILIEKNIEKGKPVISSIYYKLNRENNGHLVVINGLKLRGKKVAGFYIQDPDPNFRGHNYYLTKPQFLKNWRGGLLWLE